MTKIGIVVADAARARFITLQPADELTPERSSELIEHSDLVNPEGNLRERDLFSDRESRTHGSPSGWSHGTDDHRTQHEQELTRRFARRIVDDAHRFTRERALQRLIVVAEPRLLGLLRSELVHQPLDGLSTEELAEDLSRRSLADIREILAGRGLLPAAAPPRAGVYHPRGQQFIPR